MDKLLEFLSKARYPVVFLVLGAIFALAAAAQSIKFLSLELVPYGMAAHAGLAVFAVGMLGIGVFMVATGRGGAGPPVKVKYDLFLAAPMAGTETDEEYQSFRSLCLEVLTLMRAHCGVKTYYFVGEKLETRAQFESYDVAAEMDFDAIGASRNFVLIYPRKMVSSVLAEAGFALARGIPSTLFVAKAEDLPYLLRQAGDLPHDRFPPVHIRTYASAEELKRIIRNNGANLFDGAGPDQSPDAA